MLLDDIGRSPDTTLKKINQHLQTNYGFKITENVSEHDLDSIMEEIENEVVNLKIQGEDASRSSEISKRLLILEGLRTMRETAALNFESPELNKVVNSLVDYVVHTFKISGVQQSDFDRALERGMDEYRSSKYRFPDDMIEERVRKLALDQLHSVEDEDFDMLDEDDMFGSIGKRSSSLGGYAAEVPDTPEAKFALKQLDNPGLSLEPQENEPVPMIRDKNGRMVPDPFASQKLARRKGIIMREQENLIKNLRFLLETQVSQAEVMMAAKGFAQELQEMIEKIGRLQNEDLPPVTDQMRETYGTDSSSAFQTQIYSALQGVMDSLYTAKGQVDDSVTNMALTGRVDAETDMDKDVEFDADMGTGDDFDVDTEVADDELDLDNIANDLSREDDFGAADSDEPLGRSMKAESVKLENKILEMKTLIAKAKKLKESRV
jgi:uncharacterized protein (UPF0335 family)